MAVPSASGSGIVNKGTTYGPTSQVTSTNINAHVDDAVFNANAVDGTTINADSNGKNLFVVDGSISVAKTSFLGTVDTTADSNVKILSKQSDGQYDSVTPSGDVTMTQSGALTIANNAITNLKVLQSSIAVTKLAAIADQTIVGNDDGSSASPHALTASEVIGVLGTNLINPTSIDDSTESITFSNGLIVKFGSQSGSGSQTITFDTAFPNKIYTVVFTPRRSDGSTGSTQLMISAMSTSAFTAIAGTASGHINWIAIGR